MYTEYRALASPDPATNNDVGSLGWCQQLTKFNYKPGQQRSCRPGSVWRASVPSRFQHVSFPGVAPQVNEAGTSPLEPAIAPPPCMFLRTGLAWIVGIALPRLLPSGYARTGRVLPS